MHPAPTNNTNTIKETTMNENKKKWIDALRSGEYKQYGTPLEVAEVLRTGATPPAETLPRSALAEWLGVKNPDLGAGWWSPMVDLTEATASDLDFLGEDLAAFLAGTEVEYADLAEYYELTFDQTATMIERHGISQ